MSWITDENFIHMAEQAKKGIGFTTAEYVTIISLFLSQLAEANQTIESLRADIQTGVKDIFMKMYRESGPICAYCGERPVDKETHWETCEKHPARKKLAESEKSRDELIAQVNSLNRCIDMNGMVHEAVMHVIRGEEVSDFEESFHDVMEAQEKINQSIDFAQEIAHLEAAKECAEIVDGYIGCDQIAGVIRERYQLTKGEGDGLDKS